MSNVADRLKSAREASGLSRQTVAEALSVTVQAVGQWENNITFPNSDKLATIAEMYGCSLDWLFDVLTSGAAVAPSLLRSAGPVWRPLDHVEWAAFGRAAKTAAREALLADVVESADHFFHTLFVSGDEPKWSAPAQREACLAHIDQIKRLAKELGIAA